jgi:hypothetical protein
MNAKEVAMIDMTKWPDVKWDNRGFEATINGKECSARYSMRHWFAQVGDQIIGPFKDSDCAREACEAYAGGAVTFTQAKNMRGYIR